MTADAPSTGERLLPEWRDSNTVEHLHRYAMAVPLCTNKDVLDIASGEGYGSNLLASVARTVIGVDADAAAVAHARSKYVRSNLSFLEGDASAIPIQASSIDVAVSFETLEHLRAHEKMIDELHRVLRASGLLIISTPDKLYYSDRSGIRNPFHVRELYTDEFKALIARRFTRMRLYSQRLLTGSLVVPEGTPRGFCYLTGDVDGFVHGARLPGGLYNICIASNDALPDSTASVFEPAFPIADERPDAARRAAGLETQLDSLRSSASFRLGRAITAPVRWLRDAYAALEAPISQPWKRDGT